MNYLPPVIGQYAPDGRRQGVLVRFWAFEHVSDTTFCTSSIGGNARWVAPELYRITVDDVVPSATTRSHVYSLGSIMLEVRRPFCHSPQSVLTILIVDPQILTIRQSTLPLSYPRRTSFVGTSEW